MRAYKTALEGDAVSEGEAAGYRWREGGEEIELRVALGDEQRAADVLECEFGRRSLRLRLADAGASLICVHGRTREQNKQLSGAANWASIKAVREALAERDVVTIANGGIGDLGDCEAAAEATGCDAVDAAIAHALAAKPDAPEVKEYVKPKPSLVPIIDGQVIRKPHAVELEEKIALGELLTTVEYEWQWVRV